MKMIKNKEKSKKIIDNIAFYKRRFDRGGTYVGYLQVLISGTILGRVFGIEKWWVYAIGIIALVAFRFIAGYFEERKGVLSAEQKNYSELNPEWKALIEKIDELLKNQK